MEVTQARLQGIIHDFVMVNAMDQTQAARAAMTLAVGWLTEKMSQQNKKPTKEASF